MTKTIKAIAICGSPRKSGNTEILLTYLLKELEKQDIDTELICLSGKTITPCRADESCRKNKLTHCALKNDDFAPIFEKMKQAHIIVVGTPVYFGSATPELMALLDRAGYVSRGGHNFFSRKIGGPVAVATRAGKNFTILQLMQWYLLNDMIVPGSSYSNIGIASKEKGDIKNDKIAFETIAKFSDNLAWLAKKLY